MTTNFDDVGDFHERFDLPHVHQDPYHPCLHISEKQSRTCPGPRNIDAALREFRVNFMQEELDEFCRGVTAEDHAQMFDALLDLVYVAMGTAHLLGYPWQEGWDAVQRANMEKVRAAKDGSDSKRASAWDVVKPKGWRAPDIRGILRRYGW